MYLLLQVMVTFNYGGVMNFYPVCSSKSYPIKDLSHHVSGSRWVVTQLSTSAISVIPSFLVLQLEVEPGKGSNPLVASGIEVKGVIIM